MKRRIVTVVVGTILLSTLIVVAVGCNTIEGIGRDLRGAYDGMNHQYDSNGTRVPSGR